MNSFHKILFSIVSSILLIVDLSHSASMPRTVLVLREDQNLNELRDPLSHPKLYKMPLYHSEWTEVEKRKPAFLTNRQTQTAMDKCDGKTNFMQDLNIISLVTGVIGTILSIFTASYTSVLGNFISAISAVLSFAFGVPAALLTFMASSDRLSYITGNILSAVSFWNTVYGSLSIALGNKDIFTSQLANVIGVFSLAISVVTAFPSLFDKSLDWVGKFTGKSKQVDEFVKRYGCYGDPTFYEQFNSYVKMKLVYL